MKIITFSFLVISAYQFSSVDGTYYKEKFDSFIKTSAFSYYEKKIRPIADQSQALDVQIAYSAVSINGLDAAGGVLDIVGILTATWQNDLLIFNTSNDWNGLEGLLFPQDKFWRPTLVLDNSATSLTEVGDSSYRIRIDANGKHEWVIGLVASSACSVDVTNFPFDSHSCELIFTPWGTTSLEVTLSPNVTTVDRTHYSENVEWTFVSSSITSSIENNASYLTITIDLKRNPGYFFVNLIMPITVVALLNILVFLLPSECGERVGYAVTIFLTFAVYLDIITATLPKSTDSTAKLSNYLISMVILGALTSLMIIVSLNVYHRDEEAPIPPWLVKLSTCLHCKCGKGETKLASVAPSRASSPNPKLKNMISPRAINIGIGSRRNSFEVELQKLDGGKRQVPLAYHDKTPMMNYANESVYGDDEEEEIDVDWHYVSTSLDYLFCFITFWVTLGLTCFFIVPLALV